MRTIQRDTVVDAVAKLCIDANRYLPADVRRAFEAAQANEDNPVAREVFRQLLENADLAEESGLPLCQDTGLAVLFVEVGENLVVEGGIRDAINEGVRKGYAEGFLRKSACDPFTRANTGDNTPAIIHFDLVPGESLKISFMAKGGGSENMSRVTMLAPSQGFEGIKNFILDRVAEAGPNPCPPILVGIGIGGTFENAAILSKKALLRELDDTHPDPEIAAKENELLGLINDLGIGPMGLGGKTTCLAVKIAMAPVHLASLPLAVNIQCHSARHKEVTL
ncbi:fumarate hydratase [Oceanidesulfovibrio indonesiensis]|uniref:Fumarate hydratase n=1 Tax=Oceanidesulfovibrio indonesiensis TaxID=54767 RepID=A0A7M3MF47_9BACT|nr:fumarate hydratase [Oceanidesulfovibrio indonesiensis]TVM17182.1 fumarate hydratase [Oceanidesulfovibrio indonesiensis]